MQAAAILNLIAALVPIAERFFKNKKSGEKKKAWVMAAAEGAIAGANTVLTGGARETWGSLKPQVSGLVDTAANLFFPPVEEMKPARDFTKGLEG